MAVAEKAAKDNMPLITPTGTSAPITGYGDNVFRTCFTDPFQGKIMATFAADTLKVKTAAVIYNNSDDYSKGLTENFVATAKEKGFEIVAQEAYGADDKDFKTQLTKIQALNPDVLFVPDYYETVALIAAQAREVGFTNTMLGADGWDGVYSALDTSKYGLVDGCYFSSHYAPDDTDPAVVNFLAAFKAEYNEVPNSFAALGYDAAYMMKAAIEKAGSTDKQAIIDALASLEYTGVTGSVTFDENGDPIKPACIIQMKNGEASFHSRVSLD